MNSRALLTQLSAGRIAAGAGLLAKPGLITGMWIGADGRRPAVTAVARGLGARDLALGAGTLVAMRSGSAAELRPWLLGGLVADAADLSATLAARDRLPRSSPAVLAVLAGGALAIGALALASGQDSAPAAQA